MNATPVIGLEVHVQLATKTKLFSGAAADFAPDEPNTRVDPYVLGLPGTLPVLNAQAFKLAVKVGLALNCEIARFSKFDRKQYYYPDLPKGYQISQFDLPVCGEGWLEIEGEDGGPKRVRITRAHLEEDAGKNMHGGGGSRVDLNRAGTPLVEIVSEPDMAGAAEARNYLERLKLLLTYLGVSDCNMQEGSLRCDVNVNFKVETDDGVKPTPIAEVKNLNSFRGVEAAIEFERTRQLGEFARTGETLSDRNKTTRGWDPDRQVTVAQRTKEEAADYRYFPDPDLVPVTLSEEAIEALRAELGEFPADRRLRIADVWGLNEYDANVVIERGKDFADYFEEVARCSCDGAAGDGKRAANWCTQDVLRDLSELGHTLDSFPIPAGTLGHLLGRVAAGELNTKAARDVYADLLARPRSENTPATVDAVIDERGLIAVKGGAELETAVEDAVANPKNAVAVETVRGGKQQAVGPLMGQVLGRVSGADPQTVRQMLLDRIGA